MSERREMMRKNPKKKRKKKKIRKKTHRPYCLPSTKPQSKSTRIGRSSSTAPLRYFTASSASERA